MNEKIAANIAASIAVKQQILSDEAFLKRIETVVDVVANAFSNGNKVLFCGNGGSGRNQGDSD